MISLMRLLIIAIVYHIVLLLLLLISLILVIDRCDCISVELIHHCHNSGQ